MAPDLDDTYRSRETSLELIEEVIRRSSGVLFCEAVFSGCVSLVEDSVASASFTSIMVARTPEEVLRLTGGGVN